MREGEPYTCWIILDENCREKAVLAGHIWVLGIVEGSITCYTCSVCYVRVREVTTSFRDESGASFTDVSVIVFNRFRFGAHTECFGSCEYLMNVIGIPYGWEFVGH